MIDNKADFFTKRYSNFYSKIEQCDKFVGN